MPTVGLPNFLFYFFPCSADHEGDWPPCKVVFFGLTTNTLNVRINVRKTTTILQGKETNFFSQQIILFFFCCIITNTVCAQHRFKFQVLTESSTVLQVILLWKGPRLRYDSINISIVRGLSY